MESRTGGYGNPLHRPPTDTRNPLSNGTRFCLVALVMGVGYVAVRVGVGSVPPLALATLRFYVTALAMLAFAVSTGKEWRPRTVQDWGTVSVLGVLVFAGAIGFLFVGQQYTAASVAAVTMSLGPVLTILFAGAFSAGDRLSRRQSIGVFLGFVGAVVVAHPTPGGFTPTDGYGALFVLGAAASGSLGTVFLRRLQSSLPPATQAGWGALVSGVVLHATSVGIGDPPGAISWTPALVVVLAYLSLVVGGVGYVTFIKLVRTVGPVRTSLTAYASPVVTIAVGWAFLHEPLTGGVVLGLASIATGFVLLNGSHLGHGTRGVDRANVGVLRRHGKRIGPRSSHEDDKSGITAGICTYWEQKSKQRFLAKGRGDTYSLSSRPPP